MATNQNSKPQRADNSLDYKNLTEHKTVEQKFFDCIKTITQEKWARHIDSITGQVKRIDLAPQITLSGVAL